jgi:hypothetical protein
MKLRPIKTLRDALDTIERGMVVDQAENGVPWKVVEHLVRRQGGNNQYCYRAHCRFEGSREIYWFCQ